MIGAVIGSQVAQLTGRAPQYAATIEQKVSAVREYALERMSDVLEHVGYGTCTEDKSNTLWLGEKQTLAHRSCHPE